MTAFASERNRIKAKVVSVARPGEEVKLVAPRAKGVIEVNWWVLAYKGRVALGVMSLTGLGGLLAVLGLNWLLTGICLGAVLAFLLARPCP